MSNQLAYNSNIVCFSVNFKKNEKVYNSANSEVLKALQEAESHPLEPGKRTISNQDMAQSSV